MKYVFVVATVLIPGWLVNSIRLAGARAEHGLHAMRAVTLAGQEYVQDYGEWPASWEELKTVRATYGMIYSWPRDLGELQKYVEIDFDRTLEDLANETPDRFDAIIPLPVKFDTSYINPKRKRGKDLSTSLALRVSVVSGTRKGVREKGTSLILLNRVTRNQ